MKIIKYIFYVVVFAVIAVMVSSCLSKNPLKEHIKERKKMEEEIQKTINDYRKACKNLDFEAARECLSKIHHAYINGDVKTEIYYAAFDYIYKAEIQYILSEFDDKTCVDKITFLLTEIPIEGEKPHPGLCGRYDADREVYSSTSKSWNAYIIWTEHYNCLCNNILTLSLNRNCPRLAKAILLHYVDNVETYKGDGHVGGNPIRKIDGVNVDYDHGYIKFTSTDRDAAKKKYNEAVKMGYLK